MAEHLEDSGLEQHTLYLKRLGAYGVDHFPACHSTTQGKLYTVDSRRNLVSSWFVLHKYSFHQYFRIQGRCRIMDNNVFEGCLQLARSRSRVGLV